MKTNPIAVMLWVLVALVAFGVSGSLQVAALWTAGAVAFSLSVTFCIAFVRRLRSL